MAKRHYRVTLADAIQAHDEALQFGGRAGIVSLHSIESAIARPYSGYYPRLAQKSAALLDSVVNNHGFVDGNKRTAVFLIDLLITRSGYRLGIPDDFPIDDIVVAVANGEMLFDDARQWFADRLVKT